MNATSSKNSLFLDPAFEDQRKLIEGCETSSESEQKGSRFDYRQETNIEIQTDGQVFQIEQERHDSLKKEKMNYDQEEPMVIFSGRETNERIQDIQQQKKQREIMAGYDTSKAATQDIFSDEQKKKFGLRSPTSPQDPLAWNTRDKFNKLINLKRPRSASPIGVLEDAPPIQYQSHRDSSMSIQKDYRSFQDSLNLAIHQNPFPMTTTSVLQEAQRAQYLLKLTQPSPPQIPNSGNGAIPNTTYVNYTARSLAEQLLLDHYQVVSDEAMIRRLYADLKQKDLAEASAIVDLQILPRCCHKKELDKIFRRCDSVKEKKSHRGEFVQVEQTHCMASHHDDVKDSLCEAISEARSKAHINLKSAKKQKRKKSDEKNRKQINKQSKQSVTRVKRVTQLNSSQAVNIELSSNLMKKRSNNSIQTSFPNVFSPQTDEAQVDKMSQRRRIAEFDAKRRQLLEAQKIIQERNTRHRQISFLKNKIKMQEEKNRMREQNLHKLEGLINLIESQQLLKKEYPSKNSRELTEMTWNEKIQKSSQEVLREFINVDNAYLVVQYIKQKLDGDGFINPDKLVKMYDSQINDHENKENELQKWNEVVSFMEKNPQVLMELLPITPPSRNAAGQRTFNWNQARNTQPVVGQGLGQMGQNERFSVPQKPPIQIASQNTTDPPLKIQKPILANSRPSTKIPRDQKLIQIRRNQTNNFSSFQKRGSADVHFKTFGGLSKRIIDGQRNEIDARVNQTQLTQQYNYQKINNQPDELSDYVTAPAGSSTNFGNRESQGINLISKRSNMILDHKNFSSEELSIQQFSENNYPNNKFDQGRIYRNQYQRGRPNTAIGNLSRMRNMRPQTAVLMPSRHQIINSRRGYLPSKSSNAGDSMVGSEQNIMASRMRTNKIYSSQRQLQHLGQRQSRIQTAKARLPAGGGASSKLSNYILSNRIESESELDNIPITANNLKVPISNNLKQRDGNDPMLEHSQSVQNYGVSIFNKHKNENLNNGMELKIQKREVSDSKRSRQNQNIQNKTTDFHIQKKIDKMVEGEKRKRATQFDRLSKQRQKSNQTIKLVSFKQDEQNQSVDNKEQTISIRAGSSESQRKKSKSRSRSNKELKRTDQHQRRLMKLKQMRKQMKKVRKRESESLSDNKEATSKSRQSKSDGRRSLSRKQNSNQIKENEKKQQETQTSEIKDPKSPTDIIIKDLALDEIERIEKVQQNSFQSSLSYQLSKRSINIQQDHDNKSQEKMMRNVTMNKSEQNEDKQSMKSKRGYKGFKRSVTDFDDKSYKDISQRDKSQRDKSQRDKSQRSQNKQTPSQSSFKSKKPPHGKKLYLNINNQKNKNSSRPPKSHRCHTCSPNDFIHAKCKRQMSNIGDGRSKKRGNAFFRSPTNITSKQSKSRQISPGFNIQSPFNSGTPINLDLEHLQDRSLFQNQSGKNGNRVTPKKKKKSSKKKKPTIIDQDNIKTLIVDNDAIETRIEIESQNEQEAAMDLALGVHLPVRKRNFHEKLIRQAEIRDPEYYDQIYDLRALRQQFKKNNDIPKPNQITNQFSFSNPNEFTFKKQNPVPSVKLKTESSLEIRPYTDFNSKSKESKDGFRGGLRVMSDQHRVHSDPDPEIEQTARVKQRKISSSIYEKIESMDMNKIPMASIIGSQGYKYDGKINIIQVKSQESQNCFDWQFTDLYKLCLRDLPRFKRPKISDQRAAQIQAYLDMIQATPENFTTCQSVTPLFHFALTFLHDLLLHDLNMPELYEKIKRVYTKEMSVPTTIGILKRARIAQQLKDDAKQLLCKYLDICTNEKMIEQLRVENVSDGILQQQIKLLQKDCQYYFKKCRGFLNDFKKTFKEGKFIVKGLDTCEHIKLILQDLDHLQKAYENERHERLSSNESN